MNQQGSEQFEQASQQRRDSFPFNIVASSERQSSSGDKKSILKSPTK